MVDEAAERAFSDSAVRDEDGKLLMVYHGGHHESHGQGALPCGPVGPAAGRIREPLQRGPGRGDAVPGKRAY
jgi:hypothetical protein